MLKVRISKTYSYLYTIKRIWCDRNENGSSLNSFKLNSWSFLLLFNTIRTKKPEKSHS